MCGRGPKAVSGAAHLRPRLVAQNRSETADPPGPVDRDRAGTSRCGWDGPARRRVPRRHHPPEAGDPRRRLEQPPRHNRRVDGAPPKMVFLGYGKWARADRIYALEPITDERRGGGSRTLVWIEGIPNAIVASRTERTILHDMGQ